LLRAVTGTTARADTTYLRPEAIDALDRNDRW